MFKLIFLMKISEVFCCDNIAIQNGLTNKVQKVRLVYSGTTVVWGEYSEV